MGCPAPSNLSLQRAQSIGEVADGLVICCTTPLPYQAKSLGITRRSTKAAQEQRIRFFLLSFIKPVMTSPCRARLSINHGCAGRHTEGPKKAVSIGVAVTTGVAAAAGVVCVVLANDNGSDAETKPDAVVRGREEAALRQPTMRRIRTPTRSTTRQGRRAGAAPSTPSRSAERAARLLGRTRAIAGRRSNGSLHTEIAGGMAARRTNEIPVQELGERSATISESTPRAMRAARGLGSRNSRSADGNEDA